MCKVSSLTVIGTQCTNKKKSKRIETKRPRKQTDSQTLHPNVCVMLSSDEAVTTFVEVAGMPEYTVWRTPWNEVNVSIVWDGRRSARGGGGRTCQQPRQAGKLHIYSYGWGVNHRASISSWPVLVWAPVRGARADADAGLAPEGFPSAPQPCTPRTDTAPAPCVPRLHSRSPRARLFALRHQIPNIQLIHKTGQLIWTLYIELTNKANRMKVRSHKYFN